MNVGSVPSLRECARDLIWGAAFNYKPYCHFFLISMQCLERIIFLCFVQGCGGKCSAFITVHFEKGLSSFHLLLAARCHKFIWPILKTHSGHTVNRVNVSFSIYSMWGSDGYVPPFLKGWIYSRNVTISKMQSKEMKTIWPFYMLASLNTYWMWILNKTKKITVGWRKSGSTSWIPFLCLQQPPAADCKHISTSNLQVLSSLPCCLSPWPLPCHLSLKASCFILSPGDGKVTHEGYFSSWHCTLISPPTASLWSLCSIIPAISSLTE